MWNLPMPLRRCHVADGSRWVSEKQGKRQGAEAEGRRRARRVLGETLGRLDDRSHFAYRQARRDEGAGTSN